MVDERMKAPRDGGSPEKLHSFLAGREDVPVRLDRFLAEKLRDQGISREKVKELIRDGYVSVGDGEVRSPKYGLIHGDLVRVCVPGMATSLTPEAGDLTVIYRDETLAVLNKPAGLTVHPAPGLTTGTLAHRLVAYFPELAAQEGSRPGIVHRLDKDTSGLMLVALTEQCRLALAGMFARHEVYKEYLALVRGVPGTALGMIEAPVGRHPTQKVKMAVTERGRPAKSAWRTLYADPQGRFALVAVRIFNGRTHQVRVHMQHIGHPLWGDALYGGERARHARAALNETAAAGALPEGRSDSFGPAGQAPSRQMLHAWKLGFIRPLCEVAAKGLAVCGGGSREDLVPESGMMRFVCPPPADFIAAARFLCRETLRVVVTGSPGCGKSALLEVWNRKGIPTFSADAEVRKLYERGGDGRRLLCARFGSRFVPWHDAPVDKIALGAAMREEPLLRREVEALVHPLVRHAIETFWKEQEARGAALAVAEVPLYLEANFAAAGPERCVSPDSPSSEPGGVRCAPPRENAPVLVGVFCPFAIRRERLARRRGWSDETIALMESWQWPEEKKMAACDLILDNTGTETELRERALALAGELLDLRSGREQRILADLERLWREEAFQPA